MSPLLVSNHNPMLLHLYVMTDPRVIAAEVYLTGGSRPLGLLPHVCVIEKQTGPGEQEEGEEEEKSASKPRFHAQGWKKSFQGTPLALIIGTSPSSL